MKRKCFGGPYDGRYVEVDRTDLRHADQIVIQARRPMTLGEMSEEMLISQPDNEHYRVHKFSTEKRTWFVLVHETMTDEMFIDRLLS